MSTSIDNSDSNRHHRNRGQRLTATSKNRVENKTTTTTKNYQEVWDNLL